MKTSLSYLMILTLIFGSIDIFPASLQSVEITTEPEFADVYIGNRFLGISPLKVDLEVGTHFIKVKHPLAEEINKKIVVKENGDLTSSFHFEKERGIKDLNKSADLSAFNNKKKWIIKPLKERRNFIYYMVFLSATFIAAAYYGKKKIDEKSGVRVIISAQ